MLSRLSIKARLGGIILLVVIGLVAVVGMTVAQKHFALVEARHGELRSIIEAALAVTQAEYDRFQAGEISEDAARNNALAAMRAMRYRGNEYLFVGDMDLKMVMHPIALDLVGKDLSDMADPNGVYLFREMVNRVETNGAGVVDYMWPKPGAEAPSPKTSYVAGFESWGWFVGTGVYVDDLTAMLIDSIVSAGLVALVGIAVIAGLIMVIASSITRPLSRLATTMDALADGNVDVTIEGTERRDEIGPMARAVEAFRHGMAERARLELQAEQDGETQRMRQVRIEELIGDFRTASQDALAHVLKNTDAMRQSADMMTDMSRQTSERAEGAKGASDVASSNVQTVAAAAEELAATISEIAGKVAETTETVSRVATMTTDANHKVGSLAEAAQKIGDVVRLISDIAEQTNLLALNATIEAARAGEAGRGFAVVASEVKSLANQTAKATEEISSQINAVQGSTSDAVRAIEAISSVMADVDETTAAIAAAVEEQGAATTEISRNAQLAADGTRNVVENTEGVTRDAENTAHSASEVLSASRTVEEQTLALREEVGRFLDGVAAA
ncbi:MAG: cache domain-containing protein [Pseudomonadota bacterium]